MQVSDTGKYFPAIDGLRAIAVLAVIICHFEESILRSGYLGVDVFFVISGFVITASLLKGPLGPAPVRLKGFYKRRVKRLFPATLVVLTAGSLLTCLFVRDPGTYLTTGLSALLGVSNIILYRNQTNYWGESAELNPFTHTWSLGVEEQFYLLFPLIIVFLTSKSVDKSSIGRIALVIGMLSITSLAGQLAFSESRPEMTYFMMPFRFWEMGLGALVYCFLFWHNSVVAFVSTRLLTIAALSALLLLFLAPRGWGLAPIVCVPVLTAVIIVQMVSRQVDKSSCRKTFLESRLIVYIGKISFSLYLWHWIVIVISNWTIGISWATAPFQAMAIVIPSILTYKLIETPFRASGRRWSHNEARFFAPVIAVLVGVLVLGSGITRENALFLGDPNPANKSSLNVVTPINRKPKCSRIRTIGNSHSEHIRDALVPIGEANEIEISFTTDPYIEMPDGKEKNSELVESALAGLHAGDILILSSRNRYLYRVPYLDARGKRLWDHSAEKEEFGYGLIKWISQLDAIITSAAERGIVVIHFLPLPEFNEPSRGNVEVCEEQWFRVPQPKYNQFASKDFLAARFPDQYYEDVSVRVSEHSNFFTFDPMPYLQDENGNFPRILNGTIVYRDTNHLTPDGARLLLKPFYLFLQENEIL